MACTPTCSDDKVAGDSDLLCILMKQGITCAVPKTWYGINIYFLWFALPCPHNTHSHIHTSYPYILILHAQTHTWHLWIVCIVVCSCKSIIHCCCIDRRCAIPCDADVPCMLTCLPFCVCCVNGNFTVACGQTLNQLLGRDKIDNKAAFSNVAPVQNTTAPAPIQYVQYS